MPDDSINIGLISDTHIPATSREPLPQVAKAFAGVDLILQPETLSLRHAWSSLTLTVSSEASISLSARPGPSVPGRASSAPMSSLALGVDSLVAPFPCGVTVART